MQDLGRFIVGDELPVPCYCVNASNRPVNPDSAPTLTIFDATGTVIKSDSMPPVDQYSITGAFRWKKHIGELFTTGHYTVVVSWVTGAFTGYETLHFEIVPSGHKNGQLLELHYFHKQHANFILMHSDRGVIAVGRNPSIARA